MPTSHSALVAPPAPQLDYFTYLLFTECWTNPRWHIDHDPTKAHITSPRISWAYLAFCIQLLNRSNGDCFFALVMLGTTPVQCAGASATAHKYMAALET